MAADIYTTATQLAILLAGRAPVWSTQANAGSTTPPSAGTSGTALQDAVRTLVHVSLREQAHRRTARLTVPTLDLTCVYTVTIEGTAVAYDATADGAASRQDVIEGIAAAINADGTANLIVAASTEMSDGVNVDTVLIRGLAEEDWSIDFTESDSAVVACEADPARASMRLWWLPDARVGSTPPTVWAWSGEVYEVSRRGLVERFESAGLARLFVQLYDRLGDSADGSMVTYSDRVISVGPCLSEVEV